MGKGTPQWSLKKTLSQSDKYRAIEDFLKILFLPFLFFAFGVAFIAKMLPAFRFF